MSEAKEVKGDYKMHWRQFAAACFLVFGGQGLVMNSIGNYITPIMYVTGQGQAAVGAAISIGALAMMILLMFVGKILKRFNLKALLVVCTIIAMGTFMAMGTFKSLPAFFIAFPIMNAAAAIPVYVTGPMLVTNWFEKSKGTLTGVMMLIGNLAAVVGSLLAGALFGGEPYNNMLAFGVVGAIALVFMLIGSFMAVISPYAVGLKPYGATDSVPAEKADAKETADDDKVSGISSGKALRSAAFVSLFIMVFFLVCCGSFSTLLSNFANVTYGFTNAQGSVIMSVYMIGAAVGGLAWGLLDDKLGVMNTSLVAFICIGVGLCGLAFFSKSFGILLAFACLFGLGCSSAGVQQPMLAARFFGQKDYGAIFSKVQVAQSLGGLIAVVSIGAIVQATGSYIPALIILMVAIVLDCILLFVARGSVKRLWEAEGLGVPKL